MSNVVTWVLCGAHRELKSAVDGFEELKARVMTPAIGSMHVQQDMTVASKVVLAEPGSTKEHSVSMEIPCQRMQTWLRSPWSQRACPQSPG